MPRVLVAGKLHDSGLSILRADPSIDLDYTEDLGTDAMLARLPQAQAVLLRTQPFDAATIAACPALQIVSRHGVGYDAVDVDALNQRGIPLTIVGDVNAQTVAEHTMMLMLAASRRLGAYDAATRPGGDWGFRNSLAAREIGGKTLLIVGLGRIGRRVAHLAAAFDMRVLAYDPFAAAPPEGVEILADLDQALTQSDVVTLHLPGTDRPVLGADQIARLRPGAIVVNAARGGAVDEAALAQALDEGRLHGAGLDVFASEPPQAGNPVTGRADIVLTPHVASMTVECAERMAVAAARNIVDYFHNRLDPALVVNADAIGFGPRG